MADFPLPFLANFEVQRAQVEPLIRALRVANVILDVAFYDVQAFQRALARDGLEVVVEEPTRPIVDLAQALQKIDLGALANPEGAIVIVDAKERPHIQCFLDVNEFLETKDGASRIECLSVSGVGSSALGSAAFAWNSSTALGKPVAAIVPGYGLADVVQQALGGWFGFEAFSYWVKQPVQDVLALVMPGAASIGRGLLATAPDRAVAPTTGVPVFQRGSGSSDVLHAILSETAHITTLLGHSKGALVIENAILGLPDETLKRLTITTFGCTIGEGAGVGGYEQFIGTIDGLGMLNSGGNRAEHCVVAWHSTNTKMPLTMHVASLARSSAAVMPL
ncbi:hypothetical protein PQR12_23615 [Paraburkholderia nemoris]|uniref:hypothetical protein n=1 Tax=Paraburkholderia nemoris TaxID=2793076 RepID=UPI0038B7CD6B